MVESYVSKRVQFLKGKQKQFLMTVQKSSNIAWRDLASEVGVSQRTMSDWKREKYLIPINALNRFCVIADIARPVDIIIKDPYWYSMKGASLGGIAVYKKYGMVGGDKKKRIKKWREWWETTGKHKKNTIHSRKHISKPSIGIKLAEFVGIMLGDGGISSSHISITLNKKSDADYVMYVSYLLKELFDVVPSYYEPKNSLAIQIVISRKELVSYCKEIGLQEGNKVKHQVSVPTWITSSPEYTKWCIRGLIDTDGCLIRHTYKVKNKTYLYKKLAFSNRSRPLIDFVCTKLTELGFSPRITYDCKEIRLNGSHDVQRYFRIIDTSNNKHRTRFYAGRGAPNGKAAVC
jgi:DNA-binding XRE family transcriptional regulator